MNKNGTSGNVSSNNVKEVKFNLNKSVQVTKVFARTDASLTKNDSIFTMVDTDHPDGKREPFLSPISGTVTKLYVHEWDILSYGSIILEYEECLHTITLKNLCCDCGADLNQINNTFEMTLSRNSTSATSTPGLPLSDSIKTTVSMEHSIPELKTTKEIAERYSIEERDRLLRERKLDLLVDLDQTLVHTTNSSNYYPYSTDVIAYQLNTQTSQTFYTKLRPGVKEFLTNLLPFYQFHIVTFGERLYAHTMAKLLDPEKKFFYHRILSRNECFDPTRKTANLSALFPCGDSLVCIIDDREDVWNYARNLVHVKPYMWFKDVGDINDIHLPSPPVPSRQLIPPISEQEYEQQLENSAHIVEERVETDSAALIERTIEEGHQQPLNRGEKRKLEDGDDNDEKDDNGEHDESSKKLKETNPNTDDNESTPSANTVPDTDIYLRQLEIILKRIHTTFYSAYDQWLQDKQRPMPDLKQVLPDIRRQVLRSVSICFSHLMPQGYPVEKHRASIIAQAMGAEVTRDLQIDQDGHVRTTHIVAGKRTTKVDRALQNKIHVVTPEWLIDCYEQWEKKAEENYLLTHDYDVRKSRLFTEETPRAAKRRHRDMQQQAAESTLTIPINHTRESSTEQQTTAGVSSIDDRMSSFSRPIEINTTNLTNEILDDEIEESSNQYNFSMSVDELSDMEKEVNDFCNDDDDDDEDDDEDSSDTRPRPAKQQRTGSFAPVTTVETVEENTNDNDEYESDSSSSRKLHNLILGKKGNDSSDEDNLGDDDAPRGWKKAHPTKRQHHS